MCARWAFVFLRICLDTGLCFLCFCVGRCFDSFIILYSCVFMTFVFYAMVFSSSLVFMFTGKEGRRGRWPEVGADGDDAGLWGGERRGCKVGVGGSRHGIFGNCSGRCIYGEWVDPE